MQVLHELLRDWWGYCDHCECVVARCPLCGFGSCSGTSCTYCYVVFALINRLEDTDLPTPEEAREKERRNRGGVSLWEAQWAFWQADHARWNEQVAPGQTEPGFPLLLNHRQDGGV